MDLDLDSASFMHSKSYFNFLTI